MTQAVNPRPYVRCQGEAKVSRKKVMEKCGKTAVSMQGNSHPGVSGFVSGFILLDWSLF